MVWIQNYVSCKWMEKLNFLPQSVIENEDRNAGNSVNQHPITAVRNHQNFNGLKTGHIYSHSVLDFSQKSKIKVLAGLYFIEKIQGRIHFPVFPASGGHPHLQALHPFLMSLQSPSRSHLLLPLTLLPLSFSDPLVISSNPKIQVISSSQDD